MVRKQIYLRKEQDEKLKRQAARLGVTESELIRRRVERDDEPEQPQQLDLEAWKEARKLIEKRMKMKVPQTGRQWTRDDLYEERLERISRRQ
jgi:hypothetical protein